MTSLVGTILIGNVPIPVVHRDGDSFPSLYPYVDFDQKRFVYESISGYYQFQNTALENTDVDIWHGVINPALGRSWEKDTDIQNIRNFLEKTHNFYTKSGRFQPSSLPPRVFYYDGVNESLALDPKNIFRYGLYIANAENIAYKRFTRSLLKDINTSLQLYDAANVNTQYQDYISKLGFGTGSDSFDEATLKNIPDIQTVRPIMTFLKRFYETINKKTLSDQQLFVHNAGRYNSGATVRLDQASTRATLTDELAINTIKAGNDALEKAIDDQIQSKNYTQKIVIFDKVSTLQSRKVNPDGSIVNPTPYNKVYE